jgi:hypothetical protein
MFTRRKSGLLSKVVPILAIAGMAQSFMKRRDRKTGTLSKLISTAGLAALAMQKASSQRAGRWY